MQIDRLLTPGPVPAPPEVLKILGEPMEHHRTPHFIEVLARTLRHLKKVFATTEDVFIHPCTGSGGMEVAVVNCLSPGDECIVVVSGKFGERWAEIAEAYGIVAHRLEVPWGKSLEIPELQRFLQRYPQAKAVLTQACETSTGALHPVRAMAAEVARTTMLMMVDGITAVGACELPMDAWSIDVLVAGSQKAFMLPTGCAFTSFSKKAWATVESCRTPRFYFDVRKEKAANRAGETYFSSPVSIIKALDWVLLHKMQDGGETVKKRIAHLAAATRAGAEVLGLSVFPETPSPSLTALRLPEGIDGQKLRSLLETEHHLVTMGGQDRLKGKILRVGHMGAIEDADITALMDGLARSLAFMQNKAVDVKQITLAKERAQALLS